MTKGVSRVKGSQSFAGQVVCLAVASAAWIGLASSALADPAAVAEVERKFQGDADRLGIGPAFLRYAAADGIMFLPDPVIIRENPELVDWKGRLAWGPDLIIASRSQDLFVSTGPAVFVQPSGARVPNIFVTLWQRQRDGMLRFRIDRGVSQVVDRMKGGARPEAFRVLSGTSSDKAPDVATLDAELASAAFIDAHDAIGTRLHPEGQVLRPGILPVSLPDWPAYRASLPRQLSYHQQGSGSSRSKDLAWSYGRVTWQVQGKEMTASYFRTWIFDGKRWVIALDDIS